MLVYLGFNRAIAAYNSDITKEEAQQYLSENCLWIDDLEINLPYEEGKWVTMYLNEDNTVRYELIEVPKEEPQPSNSELLQKLQEQETANLNRDEMMLEQQLMLLDIQLNVGA